MLFTEEERGDICDKVIALAANIGEHPLNSLCSLVKLIHPNSYSMEKEMYKELKDHMIKDLHIKTKHMRVLPTEKDAYDFSRGRFTGIKNVE